MGEREIAEERFVIYERVIKSALSDGTIALNSSILVTCGGKLDRDVLFGFGFDNVTISNIDSQMDSGIAPYLWEHQDAENLTCSNESFEVVIVHAGLHHCHSPHRALLEMYRVARRVVIVFEPRDSFALNVAKRLGFTVDYEIEAVSDSGYQSGGVANSLIPNFVYRWREREVLKTIKSFEPRFVPHVKFFYGLHLPHQRFERTDRPVFRTILKMAGPVIELVFSAFPKQGNNFGFVIEKRRELQPWLRADGDDILVNEELVKKMGRVYQGHGH